MREKGRRITQGLVQITQGNAAIFSLLVVTVFSFNATTICRPECVQIDGFFKRASF
tara:strand:+ start:412 stop:579 length:168 start_codon:yes stop_codon:yes gene_type:complete